MFQSSINSKYFNFKFNDAKETIAKFKKYIKKYDCPEMILDLSSLNIIDATKVMVLSSTYHHQKYPNGKLKCHIQSDDVKNFVSNFNTRNLELL